MQSIIQVAICKPWTQWYSVICKQRYLIYSLVGFAEKMSRPLKCRVASFTALFVFCTSCLLASSSILRASGSLDESCASSSCCRFTKFVDREASSSLFLVSVCPHTKQLHNQYRATKFIFMFKNARFCLPPFLQSCILLASPSVVLFLDSKMKAELSRQESSGQ